MNWLWDSLNWQAKMLLLLGVIVLFGFIGLSSRSGDAASSYAPPIVAQPDVQSFLNGAALTAATSQNGVSSLNGASTLTGTPSLNGGATLTGAPSLNGLPPGTLPASLASQFPLDPAAAAALAIPSPGPSPAPAGTTAPSPDLQAAIDTALAGGSISSIAAQLPAAQLPPGAVATVTALSQSGALPSAGAPASAAPSIPALLSTPSIASIVSSLAPLAPAATATPTPPPVPTQAPAVEGCIAQASVSNPAPASGTNVTVGGKITCIGSSPASILMTAGGSLNNQLPCWSWSDQTGVASCPLNIPVGSIGSQATVNVCFHRDLVNVYCSAVKLSPR